MDELEIMARGDATSRLGMFRGCLAVGPGMSEDGDVGRDQGLG